MGLFILFLHLLEQFHHVLALGFEIYFAAALEVSFGCCQLGKETTGRHRSIEVDQVAGRLHDDNALAIKTALRASPLVHITGLRAGRLMFALSRDRIIQGTGGRWDLMHLRGRPA